MPEANSTSTPLATRQFERILLIKPSSLGDIVHALPVMHALRARFPHAHLAWLVAAPFASLLRDHPHLDEIITFDRRRMGQTGRSLRVSVEFLHYLRDLRARRFDLALDLQGLFRSAFLAYASGAPVRIGFAAAREAAPLFYTHRVRVRDPDLHALDKNLTIAAELGCTDPPPTIDLALRDQDRTAAAALLASIGLAADAPFIAVLPGARWETKRWFPQRFAETIDRLWTERRIPAVLLGGGDDRPVCSQVAAASRAAPADLSGKTDLRQLVAVLERAAAVLTHDSGPMHLAAALGKPLVAIFGPTHRFRTGPYGQADAVLQADLPCVPCYLKKLAHCPYDLACMRTVAVTDVVERLDACLHRG